ncbi:MAG: hypothetical protein JW969_00730 [Spirochaetales bacterium]|nr:hypothetical protein [Spirochaetales bacterium]
MITREEYLEKVKTRLDKLNAGIEKIERKAESVRDDAKAKLQVKIEDLRKKRDSAVSKIQEIKNSSEETWQDLRQGAEDVVDSLKDAFFNTMRHFKKKKPV